jgi:hypothetical protein
MIDPAVLRFIELQNNVIEILCRVAIDQDHVIEILGRVAINQGAIMKKLDELEKQVKSNTDAEQSAIVLLGGLAQLLRDAGTDPMKLAELTASLETSRSSLAAAVLANTPATTVTA